MRVLKFGGSSVANAQRIAGVIDIVMRRRNQGEALTVVVSAFSGVTDALLGMARAAAAGDHGYEDALASVRSKHLDAAAALCVDAAGTPVARLADATATGVAMRCDELATYLQGAALLREASKQTLDAVASFGERLSAYIVAQALVARGVAAGCLDARDVIVTDARFGAARVDEPATNAAIAAHYQAHANTLWVVTGFIGSTPQRQTTTLGRGGSDYTAAIIAAALGPAVVNVVEIWTDVDGVMTADPRKVARAFSLPAMTYAEALEMSHFGAKVIYPPTILPALRLGIPLLIKNTFRPEHPGTRISHQSPGDGAAVRGISSISQVALLTLQGSGMVGVPGTAARLFAGLAKHEVNVILITQGSSEHSITFAVTPDAAAVAKAAVEEAFALELAAKMVEPVRVETELAVVAVIGEGMKTRPGIAGRLFSALGANGINTVAIAQGSSELNISVVVPRLDEAKALAALHEAFFLSGTKELNLFVVGTGLVGKALLAQLARHGAFLREARGIDVRVIGIANSRRMCIDAAGVAPGAWEARLAADGEGGTNGATEAQGANRATAMDLDAFLARMRACRLPSSIFVDCSASDAVAARYEDVLGASISISTANKIAMSSGLPRYRALRALAEHKGVALGYETNVGAGLPVITTLGDLLLSGDRIIKLEGVLSGSMSYVFNHWDEATPFSALVRQARELGYTEPDPRLDLGGLDVRRKLLILARECGAAIEADDITLAPWLALGNADASVEAFLTQLGLQDAALAAKRRDLVAHAGSGAVLRFVASFEPGLEPGGAAPRAAIGVKAYPATHPFASLQGSENMLVFTTERYCDRPLVIRGPGAGADVTAAGVFAEVLRIGNTLFAGRNAAW